MMPGTNNADWYDSEESNRRGMITELQRIKRRTAVRPLPVLLLAAVVTSAVMYKFLHKKQMLEAEVVLALTESSMQAHRGVPADQLREYVTSVLLPDAKLAEVIDRHNLYPLRKTLGTQYAIEELRGQLEIMIWKNSFVYYDDEDDKAPKSARIGITVLDTDGDRGYAIAHDLAAIAIASHEAERQKLAQSVTHEVAMMKQAVENQISDLEAAITLKQVAMAKASKANNRRLASALALDMTSLAQQRKHLDAQISKIAASPDLAADQITAAGLDMKLAIVEERRPDRPVHSGFVLIMIFVVIGTGSFIGSALIVGAFDSRIHDTDDVERLGLPVLGHVPAFTGDHVGSLSARSVASVGAPNYLRWRSHQ